MKVIISEEELYPVYLFNEDYGKHVDVSEEFLQEYNSITKEFFLMQGKMATLFKRAQYESN